ncbi:MAG: hypothetical protein P8P49_02355 [Opitutales bacterium]|nr:hypothetical protein [Opitutales bacterium]
MIFPFVCKQMREIGYEDKFFEAFNDAAVNMKLPRGFKSKAPITEIERKNLDRWLLKEPRALFREDEDDESESSPTFHGAKESPRFSWITMNQSEWSKILNTKGKPLLNNCKIGMLNTAEKTLEQLPVGLESFSLVSKMGIILVIVGIKGKSISLEKVMNLNYHLAHPKNHGLIPILVPHSLLTKEKNEENQNNGFISFSSEDVSQCLSLWPKIRNRKDGRNEEKIKWGKNDSVVLKSFSELIKEDIVESISKRFEQNLIKNGARKKYLKNMKGLRENDNLISVYEASRGRTSLFSSILFSKKEYSRMGKEERAGIESLYARCMRHPSISEIVPLSYQDFQSDEFKSLNITGSQRVHMSCENALAFGVDETEFSSQWLPKWRSEYLTTYLIAFHQSVLAQDLSWSSFKEVGSDRNNEVLNKRFQQYMTNFDFSVVSNNLNHQKVYRKAREVLGVIKMNSEIELELISWLSTQRNEKQEGFNSIAAVFLILGLSTFVVNLNLKPFTNDAEIHPFNGWGALWFWVPLALGFSLLFLQSVRKHFMSTFKLLFKFENR